MRSLDKVGLVTLNLRLLFPDVINMLKDYINLRFKELEDKL